MYTKPVTTFTLRGCVDGIQDDSVVEHKQRRNRLFRAIPVYELPQLYAYMYLTGRRSARLVETYQERQLEHIVTWDESVWQRMVKKAEEAIAECEVMRQEWDVERGVRFVQNHCDEKW